MKKYFSWFLCLLVCCVGCSTNTATSGEHREDPANLPEVIFEVDSRGNEEEMSRALVIEGQLFQLDLVENETTTALGARLPLTATLEDLHQNEKFYYLSEALPTAPEKVQWIEKGDVLLFGSDCLVIFYKSFATEYAYTRIGKITEADALDFLAERDTIEIQLQ